MICVVTDPTQETICSIHAEAICGSHVHGRHHEQPIFYTYGSGRQPTLEFLIMKWEYDLSGLSNLFDISDLSDLSDLSNLSNLSDVFDLSGLSYLADLSDISDISHLSRLSRPNMIYLI